MVSVLRTVEVMPDRLHAGQPGHAGQGAGVGAGHEAGGEASTHKHDGMSIVATE